MAEHHPTGAASWAPDFVEAEYAAHEGRQQVRLIKLIVTAAVTASVVAAAQQPRYDVVIAGGTVYNGTGAAGVRAEIGITGDRIATIAPSLDRGTAGTVIDASGLAVAPGFINMLSWATESLIADGRSQGDIRQGVTTQIFGEGSRWVRSPTR